MILDEILAHKRWEVAERERAVPLSELEQAAVARLESGTRPPGMLAHLRSAPGVALIAEVKRASPSAGQIGEIREPAALAKTYAEAGATAVSVLTDARFFRGSLDDLKQVAGAVRVPLLRKDFVVAPYQIYEAALAGASCILLIAAALSVSEMQTFAALAASLGMDALVEVHDREELDRVLGEMEVPLLGINNRNLRTFETRLEVTERLAPLVPPEVTLISESGISRPDDVRRAVAAGAQGILVGEALVRSGDPAETVRAFLAAGSAAARPVRPGDRREERSA